MRRLLSRLTLAAAVATTSVVTLAAPSHAITRTSCSRTTLHTYSISGDTCWTSTGTVYVTLYRVTAIDMGNRAGAITYDDPRTGRQVTTSWRAYDLPRFPEVTVRKIVRY